MSITWIKGDRRSWKRQRLRPTWKIRQKAFLRRCFPETPSCSVSCAPPWVIFSLDCTTLWGSTCFLFGLLYNVLSPLGEKCPTQVVRMLVHCWVPAMDDGWSPPYLPTSFQDPVQGSAAFIGKVSHNGYFRFCKPHNLYFSYLTLTPEGLEQLWTICKWRGMAVFQLSSISKQSRGPYQVQERNC